MPTVLLDGFLKELGAPHASTSATRSVAELLDELERTYPRLRLKIRDETGALRRSIRVFVNGEDVRNAEGPATALVEQDRVEILHAVPGG